ncbi:MAG: site-2 protease family protein [Myxococcales bacterium]
MSGFRVFTLANVPVWVSPWHLVVLGFLSWGPDIRAGMLYALCIALSILVHEFGHALVAKLFRLNPQILLTGFGGLTGHERAQRDRDDALIIAAGPLAGLLFGLLALVARRFLPMPAPLYEITQNLVYMNFVWSFFNLLPLWPLDGGQLLRLGMLKLAKPARAERIVHITALVVLVGLIYFYGTGGMWFMMIAVTLGMQNINALQNGGSGAPVRTVNRHAVELFRNAVLAYERGDDREAARLCHQLRAEGNVPGEIMKRTWALLGIATTRKGDFEEALSYLRRAPDSPEVVEATAQCFYQLEMFEALEALVQTKAFERLPSDTREAIIKALVDGTAACRNCSTTTG